MASKHVTYRYQLHYSLYNELGKHPHEHMIELSKEFNFKILKKEPVSIADCWIFVIEADDPWLTKKFPECITVQGYPSYEKDLIAGYTR